MITPHPLHHIYSTRSLTIPASIPLHYIIDLYSHNCYLEQPRKIQKNLHCTSISANSYFHVPVSPVDSVVKNLYNKINPLVVKIGTDNIRIIISYLCEPKLSQNNNFIPVNNIFDKIRIKEIQKKINKSFTQLKKLLKLKH